MGQMVDAPEAAVVFGNQSLWRANEWWVRVAWNRSRPPKAQIPFEAFGEDGWVVHC